MTADSILPDTTTIGRTALTVSDLDPMVEFYRDIVGLGVHRRDATGAVLGAGQSPLLVLERDADAPPRRRGQAGLFHTAFRVPSRGALGAALERIESDWTLTGASDHYVSEALYLDDPEGNGVEIYRDLPEESWPRNDDGTIDIGTAPLDVEAVAAASDGGAVAPPETTVGHVHVEVTSLEAARDFYAGTLGLGVKTAAESALFLAAGGYHHHLGVNTWNRRSEPAGGRGLAWFEFVVPDGALVGVRDRLADAGESVTALERGIAVTAPDGIEIRIRSGDEK
jgi:catechol 2,3-dioxygenase